MHGAVCLALAVLIIEESAVQLMLVVGLQQLHACRIACMQSAVLHAHIVVYSRQQL
jgi:hypothetical protein